MEDHQYCNHPCTPSLTCTNPSSTCTTPAPPVQLAAPPVQSGPVSQLNWSLFKPEFAGKPDEDAETHLLRTNNWMDTHTFPEGVKVQRFWLTLVGEAGIWYESLRLISLDWNGLHTQFRQQYSKIGNTREQLFHARRSFHFDKNSETLDSYDTGSSILRS